MKFFLVLRRFQQDIATLPHGHGGGFMGEGQYIKSNILLKTNFFDSLMPPRFLIAEAYIINKIIIF